MNTSDGFVPIIAMFFALFHPTEGTKVVHQVPRGAIVPTINSKNSPTQTEPLFDFDAIKNYVIPKPALCNKLLTFKIGTYRVIGFPANIYSPHYARNSFTFNFCFVFPYESDTMPYEGNIKRIGKMFRALEEQSQILSKSEKGYEVFFKNSADDDTTKLAKKLKSTLGISKHISENQKYLKIVEDWDEGGNQMVVTNLDAPGRSTGSKPKFSSLKSLIQQIFQDLNNYSECMIPIDAANSVDIKLFPIFPPPPEVNAFDVPIATVKLDSMIDSLWDPTMLKIVPFVNGINSIQQISELSGTDFELARLCIQHLIHYKSVAIMDIFQFDNSYAATAQIGDFLTDCTMAEECQIYVISASGTFDGIPLQSSRNSVNSSNASYHSSSIQIAGTHCGSASYKSDSHTGPGTSPLPFSHSIISESADIAARFGTSSGRRSNSETKRRPPMNSHINSANTLSKRVIYTLPSKSTLFSLYRSLNQNITVRQWYIEHSEALEHIDVRKFITFGVLRGLIYRVRSYPVISKLANTIEFGISDLEKMKKIHESNNNVSERTKNYNLGALPLVRTLKANGRRGSSSKGKSLNLKISHSVSEDFDESRESDNNPDNYDEDDISASEATTNGGNTGISIRNPKQIKAIKEDNMKEPEAIISASLGQREQAADLSNLEVRSSDMNSTFSKSSRKRLEPRDKIKLTHLLEQTKDFDMICTTMKRSKKEIYELLDMMDAWRIINA